MKSMKFLMVMVVGILSLGNPAFSQKMDKKTHKIEMADNEATVIELTQVEGKFEKTNLNLKPGNYQFRVINKNVDKDLGFVIQKASDKDGDVMKTAIPNSFTTELIKKGSAQYTGVVVLKKGEYVFSCPLNPTPKYTIKVN